MKKALKKSLWVALYVLVVILLFVPQCIHNLFDKIAMMEERGIRNFFIILFVSVAGVIILCCVLQHYGLMA